MRLLELSLFVISFMALSCDKGTKENEIPPTLFSVKVEGPLEVVSDSIATDLKKYKYCIKIDQVSQEVFIPTSGNHSIYQPHAYTYVKWVRPDSFSTSSGITDHSALGVFKLAKDKSFKFYFYEPIREKPYDSIYFYFSYSPDSTFMESQTIEARLKYKTLDE